MSRNQANVQRSVKDILVSHEERIQTILKELGQGNVADNRSVQNIEKKQHQQDELSKKMMMNQRTFNNSLQLLNGRLSKVEQLLVEVSLDIRTLKKRVFSENNIHLDITEKSVEDDKTSVEVKVEDQSEQNASEEVIRDTKEIIKELATKAASISASSISASLVANKINDKTTSEVITTEEVKEEIKEEIKKTKKEKKGELSVVINENKNEEF